MNKKEKISSVSLRSIEDSLSNVKIDSVTTMDQLLSMSLYQGIYCGDYFNGTLIRRIKLKLNLFNHKINFKKFFNKRKTKILDNIQNADGFITFSYDREDLIHLSAIVMKRLLADYVKIQPIIYDQSIQNSRLFKTLSDQNDFDSVNITDILSLYDIGWSKKYKKSIMQAEKILAKKCKEFGLLNTFLMDNLKLDIRKQIIFYSSCIKFLKNKNPKFIIVESDRNNLSSPLVMASKKLLIPSFSLMHGNVQYDFGYVPILADQLLVWGAYQKKRLIKYGANEDQIRITGVPQFSNHIDGNKDDILQKLNIDKEKKIVILATSNYSDISIRIKLVKIIFRSLQDLSKIGWHGVIKLHSRDDIKLYKKYYNYNYLSIFSSNDLSKNNCFLIADYFCFFSSAIGFEALLKNNKLILINIDKRKLGECGIFFELGVIPVVETAKQLIDEIEKGYSDEMVKKLKLFSVDYFFASGKNALDNVYSSINKYVKKNG